MTAGPPSPSCCCRSLCGNFIEPRGLSTRTPNALLTVFVFKMACTLISGLAMIIGFGVRRFGAGIVGAGCTRLNGTRALKIGALKIGALKMEAHKIGALKIGVLISPTDPGAGARHGWA